MTETAEEFLDGVRRCIIFLCVILVQHTTRKTSQRALLFKPLSIYTRKISALAYFYSTRSLFKVKAFILFHFFNFDM